ncbi:hypothetical protein [Sporosarcina aquimarina]|nr:hypothetical protein [Sporosarcina aquimarina]
MKNNREVIAVIFVIWEKDRNNDSLVLEAMVSSDEEHVFTEYM